jgi:uncharacterized protein (DUF2235 family)
VKRIVICADGTWNHRDQTNEGTKKRHPTNVTKVARAILPRDASGVDQLVCYHDGVGTGGGLDHYTGGAFGDGIENNIRELYRFILYNYVEGDEIYFFGFSRGAFTVRTLAGFMNMIGLVEKSDDFFIPELYALYQDGKTMDSPEATQRLRHMEGARRACPPITFIGVWDTVGALGAPGFMGQLLNRNKYQYHDVALNAHIQHAYHALAIDERRKPFKPNLWTRVAAFTGTLEQAWFAGVHSNVGGSCSPDGLANEALHWIVEKAEALGLTFDGRFLKPYRPCFNSTMQDSMSTMYKVMGPYVRPIGHQRGDGEAIHQSAIDRRNLPVCAYGPENLAECLAQPGTMPISNTTRVPRGTPCRDQRQEE